MSVLVTFCR